MPNARLLLVCLLLALAGAARAADLPAPWRTFYDATTGFALQPSGAWLGAGTTSSATAEGLRIADPSSAPGSGRLYYCCWQADPAAGATVEVRLKCAAASEPWGCCVNLADGVHEEDVSFFPDRVRLSYAGLEARFPAAEGFHTYRLELRPPDLLVFADGKLLLDGTGTFTHTVIEPDRNRLAFGASASSATSESLWQQVRFQGGAAAGTVTAPPQLAGLTVEQGETVPILSGATFTNMFRYADGALQVADRRSTDGGHAWLQAPGPWVGSCQLPDGEVLGLDYRTHADPAAKGWFLSNLTRFDAAGRPLPTLKARLHVPDLVPFVDDDGSVRDGPWCDHAIIPLKDGSLLAANCGCFAADKTPVSSYPSSFKAAKYRGFVTRSTDRGLTWEYLSTVTADPNLGSEGCNEMDLVRAPNGDLLCLYRTGGDREHPSPLYQSRSRDEGASWGAPQRVADRGVWPNACVTREAVIVCTYGRPGNWLAFSTDSGRTWSGHFCFYDGQTTSYNSVEEVAPGRLLVMYDRSSFDRGGNMASEVVGTFFTVRRR